MPGDGFEQGVDQGLAARDFKHAGGGDESCSIVTRGESGAFVAEVDGEAV